MAWTSLLEGLERSVQREARQALVALAKQNTRARVLDCGCATGELAVELATSIGTQRLYGVDINEQMLLLARDKDIRTAVADLNSGLPFEDNTFDVVNASFVLEHLVQTDVFVKEIRRVLKPGGHAMVTVPNLASWHNVLFLLLGLQPFVADASLEVYVGNRLNPRNLTARGNRKLGHLRHFTYPALRDLVEFHGLRVERVLGQGFYPFPGPLSRLLSRIDPRHSCVLVLMARK